MCGISKQCEAVCSFMPVDIIVEREESATVLRERREREREKEKKMVRNSEEYRGNEK